MAYGRKWKPSKTAARQFAQTMDEIAEFCADGSVEIEKALPHLTINWD